MELIIHGKPILSFQKTFTITLPKAKKINAFCFTKSFLSLFYKIDTHSSTPCGASGIGFFPYEIASYASANGEIYFTFHPDLFARAKNESRATLSDLFAYIQTEKDFTPFILIEIELS